MVEDTMRRQQDSYERIHASDEFQDLRRRYRGWAFPATVAFMIWYLLFVTSANWAPGFMTTPVVGNVNIAFLFGILQFASTFLIAWLYARHANRRLDPVSDRLRARYDGEVAQ